MMDIPVRVGDVFILESLGPGFARRTGLRLYEAIAPLVAGHPVLRVHYYDAPTKAELLGKIQDIATGARETGRSPLLHFETHGHQDGLALSSREVATWRELRPVLSAVNEASNLNLLAIVAACTGLDLLKAFDYADRAPARLVIGPNRIVTDKELEVATSAFYKTVFETFDAGKAFRAMNDAVNQLADEPGAIVLDKSPFNAVSAEILFRWVLSGYFEKFRSDQELNERIERLTQNVIARRRQELGIEDQPEAVANIRALVKAHLTDHRARFEELHRRFFFIDVWPDNAARFNVTFEECWT